MTLATIKIEETTRNRLKHALRKDETYTQGIERLIDYHEVDPQELVEEGAAARKELEDR